MRFEKGMDVFTAQGEKVGSLNRVVVDAKTRDVTDIVVERGLLGGTEKVIPIGLVDVEREHIRGVLQRTGWRVRGSGGASDALGLKPTTLETRMAKLGLRRPGHA